MKQSNAVKKLYISFTLVEYFLKYSWSIAKGQYYQN